MKKNIIKFLLLILLIGGLFFVTGCNDGANQFDDDEPGNENPPIDQPDKPVDPDEPDQDDPENYYSKGFTFYKLSDADGNDILGYAVGLYEGSDTNVVIPSKFKDEPVIKISDGTFKGNTKITKVSIPSTIKIIGASAFESCTNLSTVSFEENSSLQKISDNAFKACNVISSISLPDSLLQIGNSAFYQCASIGEMVVPANVTSIGEAAFGAMISLHKLAVPFIGGGNVQAQDKDLLGYVFGRTYSINTTPTNQKYKIGMDSNGQIQTGSRTYYIPTSLVEVEILSSSENTISYCAFSGVVSVDFITIPMNIIKIESQAFLEATGIDSIRYRGSKSEWIKIVGVATDPENEKILSQVNIVYDYAE